MVHTARRTVTKAWVLAAGFLLLALVPVAAHQGSTGDQADRPPPQAQLNGHLRGNPPLSPLSNFDWYGVKGFPNERAPCEPADQMTGIREGAPPTKSDEILDDAAKTPPTHIGHITGFAALNNPSTAVGGSMNFFHIDSMYYTDATSVENGGVGSAYFMLGWDGFMRFRTGDYVLDGEGKDVAVGDVHGYSSYCVWGAINQNGPWMFIGSAFKGYCNGAASDYSTTCLDLKFFYPDSWKAAGYTGIPYAEYIMLQGSLDKYPDLDVDFSFTPGNPVIPGTLVAFTDKSEVYGWPKKDITSCTFTDPYDPAVGGATGCRGGGSGFQTTDQMHDNEKDTLLTHKWWFDTDPTTAVSFDMAITAPSYIGTNPGCYKPCAGPHNPPSPPWNFYVDTGLYTVCEHVTTKMGQSGSKCKDVSVQDQPPAADFTMKSYGCYFPEVVVQDKSRTYGSDTIASYDWTWDDGLRSSGPSARHSYELTRQYNVTLTVTDDDGQQSSKTRPVFAIGRDTCGHPPAPSSNEGASASRPSDGYDESNSVVDSDKDGVPDRFDSCPGLPNADEVAFMLDADGDHVGDSCDEDRDGDGWLNDADVCPDLAEPVQLDMDLDLVGDACDTDSDGDGIPNGADACPGVAEQRQADLDGDGAGDACDDDLDGDGHDNLTDRFPWDQSEWADGNGNGVGDNHDIVAREDDELKGRGASAVDGLASHEAPAGLAALAALGLVAIALRRRR